LPLPFAVDVNRFVPKEKTGKPIIYFKSVDIERLRDVVRTLKIDFDIFNYNSGYSEQEYQEAISHAPYIIWIGRHESQGFAFQEALSSNCPIFVIDVKSLREEINSSWVNYLPNHKLQATAASYFDSSCGLITYPERWKEDWDKFLQGNYSPREFVLNNLSPSACIKIWNETLKNLK
jgi:glycosyltransferase involved in cell wall biosynthesis